MELTDLPNIGPVLAGDLRAAGIETVEQLRAVGAEAAFLRIRQSGKSDACLHELEAIAGAVAGVGKSQLSSERKEQLRRWLRSLE